MWLQHYENWDKWEEKAETTPCRDHTPYTKTSSGLWQRGVFGVKMTAPRFRCVSVMGFGQTLIPEVEGKESVLVERFEVMMHAHFGGLEYWRVSLFVCLFEVMMHAHFGGLEYWRVSLFVCLFEVMMHAHFGGLEYWRVSLFVCLFVCLFVLSSLNRMTMLHCSYSCIYGGTPKCGHPEIRTSCLIPLLCFVPMPLSQP